MKVGDYVRTKDGKIFKWNKLCTTDKKDYEEHTRKILFVEDEIKSSPNIIDLIEEGDYVDRLRVVEKQEDYIVVETFDERIHIYKGEHINSIVTKEQFSSMEYKVESKVK